MSRKEWLVHLATVLLALGLGLAAFYAEHLNNEQHFNAARIAAQKQLAYVRSNLESNLHGDIQLVKGLVSVIATKPNLSQSDFARAAKPLFEESAHLRNIGVAPDMVVQLMYPLEGNEKAIGLDYRKIPSQFKMADLARQIRQVVLAGPLQLVQGGIGLISRIPVYIEDSNGQKYFWGLISAVIDTDKLYNDSRLLTSGMPIEIALRGRDAQGPSGEVFYGKPEIFESDPVLADIPLPYGSWQMAAIPRGGWPSHATNVWQLRLVFILVMFLVLGPFFALGRAVRAASIAKNQAESMKSRLSATLENTPNVAVQWYEPTGRIVYWNRASERIYGWTKNEAIGKTLAELIYTQQQADDFLATLKHIDLSQKTFDPVEFSIKHHDGQERIVLSTLFSIPGDEAPIFVHMDIDITERKRAEIELIQARETAEKANQAKSAFLASMSHELRTPLNAIIGFSHILNMDSETPLNESQKQAVNHILNSGRHLLELINEVLDLARIEAGKLDISIVNMSLDPTLTEAIAFIQPQAAERRILIQKDCPMATYVQADAARLRQIMLNLLSNAVKYNHHGGRVTVSCQTKKETMRISVTDNGSGIPKDRYAQLFQPFQRLGAEQTNTEGTGIGLVICKRLAEAMQGNMGFESEIGVGSHFWLELPIGQAFHDGKIIDAPAGNKQNDNVYGQVLYVEDEFVNTLIMKHIFRQLPHVKLDTTETAEAGLELIQKKPPDLILMDINLPGMSGLEALKTLKSDPRTAAIPVIAISAAALPCDIQTGLEAGFLSYLTKPFNVPELIALVRDILNKQGKNN